MIGGSDCGFSSQATFTPDIHPSVVRAKLRVTAEGTDRNEAAMVVTQSVRALLSALSERITLKSKVTLLLPSQTHCGDVPMYDQLMKFLDSMSPISPYCGKRNVNSSAPAMAACSCRAASIHCEHRVRQSAAIGAVDFHAVMGGVQNRSLRFVAARVVFENLPHHIRMLDIGN